MKRLIAKIFNIYTFDDFKESIYKEPITLTQLRVLHDLQPKAHFDYQNNSVEMTTEVADYYAGLLGTERSAVGKHFMSYMGYEVKEIPNNIGYVR